MEHTEAKAGVTTTRQQGQNLHPSFKAKTQCILRGGTQCVHIGLRTHTLSSPHTHTITFSPLPSHTGEGMFALRFQEQEA